MKVNPSLSTNVQSTGLNKPDALSTGKVTKSGEDSKSAVSKGEILSASKVDISEAAQRFKMAQEIASTRIEVNEQNISRLQKLIDSGEYNVRSEEIADKMVDEHLLMPS